MISDNIAQLEIEAQKLGCNVIHDVDLKKYTTFKIGGAALSLIDLKSKDECVKLITFANDRDIPYYVLGNGSNIIADDKGISAVIFHISGGKIELLDDGTTIECYAGTPLVKLCNFALDNELGGLEFAYGIPGSVGGAVYMNAGAYGGEIKDVIVSAEILKKSGQITVYDKDSLELSYRKSSIMGSGDIILSAKFKLQKSDRVQIKAQMDDFIERRRSKQPLEYPSAGSTFKRPEGTFASLLIDQCGLKGLSVGDAEVSTKHGGFIINKGSASFDDLMELIGKVRSTVKEKTGYTLECEPEIISDRKEYQK